MKDQTAGMFIGATAGLLAVLITVTSPTTPTTPTTTKASVGQSRKPSGMTVIAKVTAYCPCSQCCGKYSDGKTSRNRDAWKTRGVAVDPRRIPYGSKVTIPGAGIFVADDTGGAMRNAKGTHIDLRFHSHKAALEWGVRILEVTID